MFKKETEYALRSLIYVQIQNYQDKTPGVVEIAKEINTPKAFTAKILQKLVRCGFIGSIKGKNGGFFFESGKPELSLKLIINAIEGDNVYSGCGLGLDTCDESCSCPLHESFSTIRDSTEKLISEVTIQKLANKKSVSREIILKRL
jgi:Rrf2 family protein